MMRRELLHGATSHMMKDDSIVGEHQVDGTRLLIYIYIIFIFCHTYVTSKILYLLASLLQCIGQNFCMNYIQIVVFLYIILRSLFIFIFCVNNCLS